VLPFQLAMPLGLTQLIAAMKAVVGTSARIVRYYLTKPK
jgi:hypothetical protein